MSVHEATGLWNCKGHAHVMTCDLNDKHHLDMRRFFLEPTVPDAIRHLPFLKGELPLEDVFKFFLTTHGCKHWFKQLVLQVSRNLETQLTSSLYHLRNGLDEAPVPLKLLEGGRSEWEKRQEAISYWQSGLQAFKQRKGHFFSWATYAGRVGFKERQVTAIILPNNRGW